MAKNSCHTWQFILKRINNTESEPNMRPASDIKPNDFFRQATLHICGDINIEKALLQLIRFLKKEMPVQKAYLQFYDPQYQAMRSIAYADGLECRKLDLITPLSQNARKVLENPPAGEDVYFLDDTFPITKDMSAFHNQDPTNAIVVPLNPHKNTSGYFVLLYEPSKKPADEHLNAIASLKEPLNIAMSNALKHREVIKLNALLADENRFLHKELRRFIGDEIVGADFGLKRVMHQIQQVAAHDSPVLLLGETGVGKDVVANTIHCTSSRSKGPFVSVNCGAIPETMIDSELFGHEKGAFTGALTLKRGRFERADKGTIFLDEIGELPLQAQVRLLRVLQNREIERIGGSKTIPLDIRIISATNRNLEQMVTDKQFREDLWFRLNVFPVVIPPLRERRLDIPALIQHFIHVKCKEMKLKSIPTLGPGAAEMLMQYDWPGNVRELQNIIERALILNPEGPLTFDNLGIGSTGFSDHSAASGNTDTLDDVISKHILEVLRQTGGKISGEKGAAKILNINPSTLRNRMKKLGIAK